jgi:hypothetical protein
VTLSGIGLYTFCRHPQSVNEVRLNVYCSVKASCSAQSSHKIMESCHTKSRTSCLNQIDSPMIQRGTQPLIEPSFAKLHNRLPNEHESKPKRPSPPIQPRYCRGITQEGRLMYSSHICNPLDDRCPFFGST